MTKKKGVKKSSSRKVLSCAKCHSPHLKVQVVQGTKVYTCARCGHTNTAVVARTKKEAKETLLHRRKHLQGAAKYLFDRREKSLMRFSNIFPLRLWFSLIGAMLLVLGLVLMTAEQVALGVILFIVGVLGVVESDRFVK